MDRKAKPIDTTDIMQAAAEGGELPGDGSVTDTIRSARLGQIARFGIAGGDLPGDESVTAATEAVEPPDHEAYS